MIRNIYFQEANNSNSIDTNQQPYAVVQFEDGIEVIKTYWAVYDNGEIIGSYFPPNVSQLDLKKLLLSNEHLEFDKLLWSNREGFPYPVEKVFCLASEYVQIRITVFPKFLYNLNSEGSQPRLFFTEFFLFSCFSTVLY